jgi:hypothetical protein
VAEAGPREARSRAEAFGQSSNVTGPSSATSHTVFDGKLVKGIDEVIGYDLHVGPVLIKQMHSTIEYQTDGTRDGTKGTWKVEFSGVGNDTTKVYSITPEGLASQGRPPKPGAAGVKQINDGARAFADALEKAGVARDEVKIAPGSIDVRDGELAIEVAALEVRNALVPTRNTAGHAQGAVFGFQTRYIKSVLGPCDADVNQFAPGDYPEPPDNSKEIGPFKFPDPSPPEYGGPKSTGRAAATPVPAKAIVPPAPPSTPTTPPKFSPAPANAPTGTAALAAVPIRASRKEPVPTVPVIVGVAGFAWVSGRLVRSAGRRT